MESKDLESDLSSHHDGASRGATRWNRRQSYMTFNVKNLAQEQCVFHFYRDNTLYYRTAKSGFVFPIPTSDTGTGTFNATERGMTLLRWIRKAVEALKDDAPPSI
jgi:hypothetical protein